MRQRKYNNVHCNLSYLNTTSVINVANCFVVENLSPIVADTPVRPVRWGCAGVAAESGTEAECGKLAGFQFLKRNVNFKRLIFFIKALSILPIRPG